jgi:hypothetical protein
MSLNFTQKILYAMTLVLPLSAIAQNQYIAGAGGDSRFSMSSSSTAKRVGKGALVWVLTRLNDISGFHHGERIYAACDGSLISSAISFKIIPLADANQKSVAEVFVNLAAIKEDQSASSFTITPYDENSSPYTNFVKKNIAKLCGPSLKDSKNEYLPLAATGYTTSKAGDLHLLITGRVSKNNSRLNFWVRVQPVIGKEIMHNGQVFKDDEGKPMIRREYLNASHSLTNWLVDCSKREFNFLETIEYNESGSVTKMQGPAISGGGLATAAPGTVADGVIANVCAIF